MARPNVGDLIPIGAIGNAKKGDVLQGKTYSSDEGVDLVGTMPNRGGVNRTLTTQGGTYTIPEGYHDGTGTVKAQFANLIASNIRDGVTIGGVRGKLKTLDLSSSTSLISIKEIALDREERVTETFSSGYSLIIALLMSTRIDITNEYFIMVRFNNKNLRLAGSNWHGVDMITIRDLTNSSVTLENTSTSVKERYAMLTVIGVD